MPRHNSAAPRCFVHLFLLLDIEIYLFIPIGKRWNRDIPEEISNRFLIIKILRHINNFWFYKPPLKNYFVYIWKNIFSSTYLCWLFINKQRDIISDQKFLNGVNFRSYSVAPCTCLFFITHTKIQKLLLLYFAVSQRRFIREADQIRTIIFTGEPYNNLPFYIYIVYGGDS